MVSARHSEAGPSLQIPLSSLPGGPGRAESAALHTELPLTHAHVGAAVPNPPFADLLHDPPLAGTLVFDAADAADAVGRLSGRPRR